MDYQSNSNKKKQAAAKAEEKKIEKVVENEVVQRKKPLGTRFKDVFFGGDFKQASRYIAADVLLPAVRNLIVDASTEGIRRMVYGETASQRRRHDRMEYRPRMQYNSPINRAFDPRRMEAPPTRPIPNTQRVNDLVLRTREEADTVIERLIDIIDQYEVASLADLYELVGLPSTHVDQKWGWSYMANIEVNQVRDGYLISLPPVEPI